MFLGLGDLVAADEFVDHALQVAELLDRLFDVTLGERAERVVEPALDSSAAFSEMFPSLTPSVTTACRAATAAWTGSPGAGLGEGDGEDEGDGDGDGDGDTEGLGDPGGPRADGSSPAKSAYARVPSSTSATIPSRIGTTGRRRGGLSARRGTVSVGATTGSGVFPSTGTKGMVAVTGAMGPVRSPKAEYMCAALWNRAAGSFSIARRVTASRDGGTDGSRISGVREPRARVGRQRPPDRQRRTAGGP